MKIKKILSIIIGIVGSLILPTLLSKMFLESYHLTLETFDKNIASWIMSGIMGILFCFYYYYFVKNDKFEKMEKKE